MDAPVRAIPSDWVSINEVGPESHPTFGRSSSGPSRLPSTRRSAVMHQNPLIAHMTSEPVRARRCGSDVSTARDFHALEIYRELFGPSGSSTNSPSLCRRRRRGSSAWCSVASCTTSPTASESYSSAAGPS